MAPTYQEKYDWYMASVVDRTESSAYLRLKGMIDDYNWVEPPPPPPPDVTTDSIAGAWWATQYTGEELPS